MVSCEDSGAFVTDRKESEGPTDLTLETFTVACDNSKEDVWTRKPDPKRCTTHDTEEPSEEDSERRGRGRKT